MLTRGGADEGNIEAWHHGRWAWVGNRSCSRNCIFQQIFTITFWYCCVTHSHRFHLAYLPAVRVGSLTPWPFQCLRKNLFRTGKSTKNYRDILTSLSSEAMQILGSVVVSWKYVVANIRRLLVANPTENWEKSSRKKCAEEAEALCRSRWVWCDKYKTTHGRKYNSKSWEIQQKSIGKSAQKKLEVLCRS